MKYRKQLALLTAIAVSGVSMVGCGSNSSTGAKAGGKQTLTVLTHRTDMDEVFKKYKEEFEGSHDNVEVNFENIEDYQNNVSTRMGTEEYGDVLMMPANITKNQFADFYEPMGTRSDLEKKYNYLDNATVGDQVYGLPTGANALGFVYNAQIFKDAGIENTPATPEEYINDLKQIKEKCPNVIPYYTNYHDSWTLTNFSNGIEISMAGDTNYMNEMLTNENEFLKGSATYDSLKLLYDAVSNKLVEEDPMTSDWERSKQDMADGKIAVMCLGSWAVGQIKDKSKTPENIKFMPAPETHNGKQMIQVSSDYNMGVNKHSKNIELAKEFVEYFVQKYPENSNMLSSIKGSKLPDFLDSNDTTEIVEGKPGSDEDTVKLDKIQKESLLNLNDPNWIKPVVEIGLGNGKQSFDEYMASLNSSWVKGIQASK